MYFSLIMKGDNKISRCLIPPEIISAIFFMAWYQVSPNHQKRKKISKYKEQEIVDSTIQQIMLVLIILKKKKKKSLFEQSKKKNNLKMMYLWNLLYQLNFCKKNKNEYALKLNFKQIFFFFKMLWQKIFFCSLMYVFIKFAEVTWIATLMYLFSILLWYLKKAIFLREQKLLPCMTSRFLIYFVQCSFS